MNHLSWDKHERFRALSSFVQKPMAAPAFAPLPPANIRLSVSPEEWEACLEAWISLAEFTLRLPKGAFNSTASDGGSLPMFLTSFYHELAHLKPTDSSLNGPAGISLRKVCFRLVSRIFIDNDSISKSFLGWDFLANFCHAHVRSVALPRLMSKFWGKRSSAAAPILQMQKDHLVKSLEAKQIDIAMNTLAQLGSVTHASSDIGSFFMTGSDFLDSIVGVYSHSTSDAQRKALSTVTYLCLISLVRTDVPNTSLLSDHFYALKGQADKGSHSASLLADVVTNTPLLAKLRLSLHAKTPDRLPKLLDTLETYRSPSILRFLTQHGLQHCLALASARDQPHHQKSPFSTIPQPRQPIRPSLLLLLVWFPPRVLVLVSPHLPLS